MITKQEWIQQAEDYEKLAMQFLDTDPVISNMYSAKAEASRIAATYAVEENDDTQPK